ncbi:exodeoxyribonuclease VII large subunit [Vulgatibacter incomptus]|uniref:exodeoxyribonuclease VII large subunit n=1 Tax=Vulgatibacter incomptus TaxID=1391653 RepID=UPI0014700271|nr:exodeoxyribonuclease VII large subunit [Vulgatibacter incomptus]
MAKEQEVEVGGGAISQTRETPERSAYSTGGNGEPTPRARIAQEREREDEEDTGAARIEREGGIASASGGPEVVSVGELARRIKGSLEGRFGDVLVRGEISNLRQPGSGHLYFSLKDASGSLRAVLFRGQARRLRFRPDNGQEVVARGRVSFYEVSGDAQLVCESLDPVGAGALALAFEQRKAKLAAEGLFDPARKRQLPFLPRRIGVVTSPTGAAIHDFVRVLHRRFPGIAVLVAPARVQGAGAADEIAAGIERLGARGDCEIVVVTRGGGSIEDLWAFNEEVVARAIAACPVPVVSAVGHEVDFTIADFVADLRAPTPTGAAERIAPVEDELRAALAVTRSRLARSARRELESRRAAVHRVRSRLGDPTRRVADERLRLDARRRVAADAVVGAIALGRRELRGREERLRLVNPVARLKRRSRELDSLRERLSRAARGLLRERRAGLRSAGLALGRAAPRDRVLREGQQLGELRERLFGAIQRALEGRRARIDERAAQLRALSPLQVLARGYAIAFAESGAVLLSSREIRAGQRLHLELADGALTVEVLGEAPERKG